jgi:hypothetical protein
MLTVHPTLLIGPSDWDAGRITRAEFGRRLDALWAAYPEAERAIIFGNSRHHAELAYFTNLVPKLGPALALMSRGGEHRMFVGDAANMLGAARPLTFIENLASMKDAAAAVAAGKGQCSLLIGADYMPMALRTTIAEAAGNGTFDATAQVWAQMARKSGPELAAINAGVKLAGVARKAMRNALMAGAGISDVILAGERAANGAGAQDVRTLVSPDQGRTLRPLFTPFAQSTDPLLAYLAVRRFNYWAECFPLFTQREPSRLHEKAWDALVSALSTIRAGVGVDEVARVIAEAIAPYQVHPVIAHAWVQRMGLSLDEPPYTYTGESFEEGEVYSLRIGLTGDPNGSVICSRMFVVGNDGITAFDEQS